MCYCYRGGDREKEVYTIRENNTWTRIDWNLNDRTKHNSHGTWKNAGNNQYPLRFPVSGTTGMFQYDKAKDELYDPNYQETYHRTVDPDTSPPPAPVINLTLNSEQKVSRVGNHSPFSDNLFLIVNVTIRNSNEREGYSLDEKGIQVRSDDTMMSYSITGKMTEVLDNPLRFGTVAPGETRQGNVVFAVAKNSHLFSLRLADSNGDDASNSINFENKTAF